VNEFVLLLGGVILGAGGVALGYWLRDRRVPAPPDLDALESAILHKAAARLDSTVQQAVADAMSQERARQAEQVPAAPQAAVGESTTPPADESAPEAPPATVAATPPADPSAADDRLVAQRKEIQARIDALEAQRTILPPDVFSRRRSALFGELEMLMVREQENNAAS